MLRSSTQTGMSCARAGWPLMSLRLMRLTACLFLFLCVPISVYAEADIQPEGHPNHYIILIDASGSANFAVVRKSYQKALREVLLQKLYYEGFGPGIPAFDPQQDILTLQNFGIVAGAPKPYSEHLHEFRLLTDFIHPLMKRESGVSISTLQEKIVPQQYYGLTILSWSKRMALWAAQIKNDEHGSVAQRTFLITVSDGRYNENDIKEELEIVDKHANSDDAQAVKKIVGEMAERYKFTDGQDREGMIRLPAVQATPQSAQVFLEAGEVIPVAQANWEDKVRKTEPLGLLDFQWTKEDGPAPQGIVRTTAKSDFLSLMKQAEISSGTLSLSEQTPSASANWNLNSTLTTQVTIPGALTCEAKPLHAVLKMNLTEHDEYLGKRSVRYSYLNTFQSPLPGSCTRQYYLIRGALVLAVALALWIAFYIYKYRYRETHLALSIPGFVIPFRLKRRDNSTQRARITPRKGLEAFTLLLPDERLQRLFYKNATLSLSNGNAYWNTNGEKTLTLPLRQRKIKALWSDIPSGPAEVVLDFAQGKSRGCVSLLYPSEQHKQ